MIYYEVLVLGNSKCNSWLNGGDAKLRSFVQAFFLFSVEFLSYYEFPCNRRLPV